MQGIKRNKMYIKQHVFFKHAKLLSKRHLEISIRIKMSQILMNETHAYTCTHRECFANAFVWSKLTYILRALARIVAVCCKTLKERGISDLSLFAEANDCSLLSRRQIFCTFVSDGRTGRVFVLNNAPSRLWKFT